jgi:hypothetical protein
MRQLIALGLSCLIILWLFFDFLFSLFKKRKSLINTEESIRDLTPEESSALQPIVIASNATRGPEVFSLNGKFQCESRSYGNGRLIFDNSIDGIRVLLPYDAIDFIKDDNQAEVVMTNDYLVVIRLNGFSIVEGYARHFLQAGSKAEEERLDKQFFNMKLGNVPPSAANPLHRKKLASSTTDLPQPDPCAHLLNAKVTVLGERQETREEVIYRMGNRRVASALCWLGSFFLFWLATWDTTQTLHLYAVFAALATAALALWLLVRNPPLAEPRSILRVRGMVNNIFLVPATTGNTTTLFLGDRFAIKFPIYWEVNRDKLLGQVVEMEVCTPGHNVVRMGKDW